MDQTAFAGQNRKDLQVGSHYANAHVNKKKTKYENDDVLIDGYVDVIGVEPEVQPAQDDIDVNSNHSYVDVAETKSSIGRSSFSRVKRKMHGNKSLIISVLAMVLSLVSIFIAIGLNSQNRTSPKFDENRIIAKQSLKFCTKLEILKKNFEKTIKQDPSLIYTRRDCSDVSASGFTSNGFYSITVNGRIIDVYCDLENDGGNWTVIQRRANGSVDFFRTWVEYQIGFGLLNDEFWIGLDTMNFLTTSRQFELRINLQDWNGNTAFASYKTFSVESARSLYVLHVGNFSGTAGDSLHYHDGQQFTTKDMDNDSGDSGNCAVTYHGAWWYKACYESNLNGQYLRSGVSNRQGVIWYSWMRFECLRRVEMKIRPIFS